MGATLGLDLPDVYLFKVSLQRDRYTDAYIASAWGLVLLDHELNLLPIEQGILFD
jgi:hypothetical protein